MWGPVIAVVWIAALSLFVYAWMKFAARRHKLVAQILDDRQRRIDNELTDMTLRAIRFEELTPAEWDARAEVEAMWAMNDREARS